MRIDILSVFPKYLDPLGLSLVGKAEKSGRLSINVHDLRSWGTGVHNQVDDTPYGGGPGMVMKADVWGEALDSLARDPEVRPILVIPTPSGALFSQGLAHQLSRHPHLVFACGRYEGIDARVSMHYREREDWHSVVEVSIGDYVLAGGEAATLVMVESIVRLVPEVLGNAESASDDSFSRPDGLLEGPSFTKPQQWRGLTVPSVLVSGDHGAIATWRNQQARQRTSDFRPDLLGTSDLSVDTKSH